MLRAADRPAAMCRRRGGFERVAVFALLVGVLALIGCGRARLIYSYADDLFVGMVQDYFQPTPEQLRAVRQNAQALLAWHRQQELPLYVAMFSQAAQKMSDGLAEDEVRWGMAQVRTRYDALAQRIVESHAPLLIALSADNLTALESKFATENAKLERAYLDRDLSQRAGRRIARVQKQLQRWIGALSAQQQAIVAAWVAAAPSAAIEWYQERVRRQQSALAALRTKRDPTLLAARLTEVWLQRGSAGGQRARNESRVIELILSIDRTLSESQRARAVRRMQQYADEFRSSSE